MEYQLAVSNKILVDIRHLRQKFLAKSHSQQFVDLISLVFLLDRLGVSM
jgi:hypothetical protein